MKNKKSLVKKMTDRIGYLALLPVAYGKTGLLEEADETKGEVASGDIFDIMKSFISWAVAAIGLLGVIMFIVAGFQYLTASGDDDQIQKAKRSMMFAVVGIAVAILGLVAVRTIDYIVR